MAAYANANWQLLPESDDDEEGPHPAKSWVLTKLPDMSRQWRQQNSLFLNLPGELRHAIYSIALRHKKRWNLRHCGDCRLRDRYGDPEEIIWNRSSRHCGCAKAQRNSLSLLLTCRQVNHEATPIYYHSNVMCFFLPEDNPMALFRVAEMRSVVIENLRHISIMGWGNKSKITPRMWQVILNCGKLQTLEVPYETLHTLDSDLINQLCSLPYFRKLRAVSYFGEAPWGRPVMCRLLTEVPLPLDEDAFSDFHFRVQNYESSCAAAWERQVYDYIEATKRSRKVEPYPYYQLDVTSEDTKQWVRICGAPNTSLTCSRLKQADWKEANERMAAARLDSVRETKKKLEERRKEEELDAQIEQDFAKMEEREARREQLKNLDKADERKQKKKATKNAHKQQEVRQQERKRAGRG